MGEELVDVAEVDVLVPADQLAEHVVHRLIPPGQVRVQTQTPTGVDSLKEKKSRFETTRGFVEKND